MAEGWPPRVRYKFSGRTSERLYESLFAFWDDEDFLSLSELQNLTPEHARHIRELLRLPDEAVQQMEVV